LEKGLRKRVKRQKCGERKFGEQGVENERVEILRAERECRVQKEILKLHRTLDSAVDFGPGEKVLHLGSGAAHIMDLLAITLLICDECKFIL